MEELEIIWQIWIKWESALENAENLNAVINSVILLNLITSNIYFINSSVWLFGFSVIALLNITPKAV